MSHVTSPPGRLPAFFSSLLAILLATPLLAAQPSIIDKAAALSEPTDVEEILAPLSMTMQPQPQSLLPMALGNSLVEEVEANNSPASAMPLPGPTVRLRGDTFPANDLDYFSFSGNAGDRVYAATMTALSPGSTDSTLTLFSVDGTTIIETDVSDGSFGGLASSFAGAVLPASGTYFLQVRSTTASTTLRPYDLYFQLRSGSPIAETEPNELGGGGQALPGSGWVSGAAVLAADNDVFSFSLNAGDTVFLSLDLDPERDAITWNGRLGLGPLGTPAVISLVNDASSASPNSEAFFFTVKEAGNYFAYVDNAVALSDDPSRTFHLSVSVFPTATASGSCTTYASTNVPVAIPDAAGPVTSSIIVPGNPRIADLDVSIQLNHTNMPDLDLLLQAPGGNQVLLFADRGNNAQPSMDLRLDDEAAIPITSFSVMSGTRYQTATTSRLSWFDNQDAGGAWSLQLYDDAAGNTGTLTGWSLTICEVEPPPTCPAGTQEVVLTSTDFETTDGGFTASGIAVGWAWGTPSAAPIATCASGSGCWKTNLAGNYAASSDQTLLSPAIDLSGMVGPILMRWSQKYHLESATFDNASVRVQEVGGGNPTPLWRWLDGTMNTTVGTPTVTLPMTAGWSQQTADISAYAGQSIEAAIQLTTDTTVQLAGIAIDDFSVTACEPLPPTIAITLGVAQGPADPMNPICSADTDITVPLGAEVEYCYSVTNTGGVALGLHSLEDSELGTLLNSLPYNLSVGSNAFLTAQTTPAATAAHTATWTAFNPGPTDVAVAMAQATVTVDTETQSFCNVDPVTVPSSGVATPYPSTIDVNILGSSLAKLRVRLNRLSHTRPDDLDLLLVGPQGQNLVLMSDAGGEFDLSGVRLLFDDDAADALPDSAQIVSGTFRPTDFEVGADTFPAPAPAPSLASQLAVFNGSNPNGTWSLHAVDDVGGDSGQIALGWCLEVKVDTPVAQIDVSPASVSASLPADQTTQQTLTIANLGDVPLNWSVAGAALRSPAEPPGMPEPRVVDSAMAAERFDAEQPTVPSDNGATSAAQSSWRGIANVLYDNGPLVTNPGDGAGGADASVLQTNLALTLFGYNHALSSGYRVADDFTVTDSGWYIGDVVFFAYQTGSPTTSTITGVSLRIWDGPPGEPGSSVVFGDAVTNRLRNTQWTGAYRVTDTAISGSTRPIMANTVAVGAFLPPGTYWMDWQTDGTLVSGPWAPPVSILGQTSTGNALQFDPGVAAWIPAVDGTNAQGLPFLVSGVDDCDNPADFPWLTVTPDSGSVAAGASSEVVVGLDSSGLAPGLREARLCIASNDPDTGPAAGTNLVVVPVQLTVEATPSISLEVTVGTDSGVCAGGNDLTVDAGTTVYYCYSVTNTGNVSLDLHDLVDDQLGTVFTGLNFSLAPGAGVNTVAAGLSIPVVINASVDNIATWTAYNAGPSNVATDQASASVTLAQPSITLEKTVGTVPGVCASTSAIAVPPGTEVTYCYTVTNTGNVTLNLHDLEDDQLGVLFSGLDFALLPGGSTFILETTTLNDSVVNTAIWDAYNTGPVNVASGQDSATVVVSEAIFTDGFEQP